MNISVKKGELQKEPCDILVLNAFEGTKEFGGATATVDRELDGLLLKLKKEEAFKGQMGQTLLVRTEGLIPARRVLLVGLGKKEEFSLETVREAAAVSLQAVRAMKPKKVVSVLHGAGNGGLHAKDAAQAMVEGLRLVSYAFARYKKQNGNGIGTFEIVTNDRQAVSTARKGMEIGELFAQGTTFARDLVNTPAMHMRPIDLVDAAKAIGKKNSNIRIRVYDRQRMEQMGMGGILGVAQGSDHPPYLVHMIYKPAGRPKKKAALVGKAVTFDSGGLSLKPADYMMSMKSDMAGAASVLGAFSVLTELSPKVEVHGIFAAVENMPSGKAIRPGDVVEALNKKTVEVLNTDAEGRLTLMDALVFAQKQKPDFVIDLATLTGACMVALGEEITGVMSNNTKLAQDILSAASSVGEKMWELPLEKNYKKLLKSQVADLQNIGGKYGGALTAGLFLQEFVDPNMPWAHLDIAGPSYAERDMTVYLKKGATGHGVRTLLQLLLNV